MTIKEQYSQNKPNRDFSSEKTYNNIPCPEGCLIVPIVVKDKKMVLNNQMNTNNFKTWKFGGRTVTVAFTIVPADNFENAMKVFSMEVNEYLSRHTNSKNRELSLEQFYEEMYEANDEATGFEPAISESEIEKLFLMESLEELISEVEKMDVQCGKVLRLIYSNVEIRKKEIFEKLGLSKTRGYEVVKKAHTLAKATYYKLNS
ncbi:TPA: hypothetical protein ACGOY9_000292 [Streptococcus suis]